jgi:UDP-2-acetamido-3-amino-2,3-dideoxy-glucuronate N-acetyltransferase
MARDPSVFVHPAALCESDDLGPRTRVWAFAHVLAGARIGADGNVGGHAFVEGGVVVGDRVTIKNGVLLFSGVTVEDEVFLGPGAVFTNDATPRAAHRKGPAGWRATLVRRGATVGANATVLSGLTIGCWAMVGAGAVVTGDVPAHAVVVGNPARQTGWACRCGRTLAFDRGTTPAVPRTPPDGLECPGCGRAWRLAAGTLEERSSGAGQDG